MAAVSISTIRKPAYSFDSRLGSSIVHLPITQRGLLRIPAGLCQKGKWQTTIRAGLLFCVTALSSYCDAERRETLRYICERIGAPIGAQRRHDLRLELLYLFKMYGPDTPLIFIQPPLPRAPDLGARQGENEDAH